MSAEALGKAVLQDVHVESLAEVSEVYYTAFLYNIVFPSFGIGVVYL